MLSPVNTHKGKTVKLEDLKIDTTPPKTMVNYGIVTSIKPNLDSNLTNLVQEDDCKVLAVPCAE